jgi:stress-induced morphogen
VSAVFDGVTRDQFMARHRANHVNIAYANDYKSAIHALAVKSAMFQSLGVRVHLCGKVPLA